jgi:hypothetical protein
LSCRQIWLSPLVDDRRPTYLRNLKKRTLQSMVGSNGESDDDDEEELGASVR